MLNCALSRSPVVPGGVVAMDRHYFRNIGAYDSDMTLWGAENLELSIRVRVKYQQVYLLCVCVLRAQNLNGISN